MCPWIWRFKKGWLQNGQGSWFSPKCFSFTWRLQLDCIEKTVLQIAQTNPLSKPSFRITKSLIPEIIREVMLGTFIFWKNAQIYGGSCNSLSTLYIVHHPLGEPGFWKYPSVSPWHALYSFPCAVSLCCTLCTSTQCQFSKLNPERLK